MEVVAAAPSHVIELASASCRQRMRTSSDIVDREKENIEGQKHEDGTSSSTSIISLEDHPFYRSRLSSAPPVSLQERGECFEEEEAFESKRPRILTKFFVAITDQLRSFLDACEESSNYSRKSSIDLDDFLSMVKGYNLSEKEAAKEFPRPVRADVLLRNSSVVSHKFPTAEEAMQGLSELEKVRLRANERRYQKSVGAVGYLREQKKEEERIDTLAHSTNSLAMGVNTIVGLFLTFLVGYWGAKYNGVKSETTRLLLGLVMSLGCLLIEVVLLILYDTKHSRMDAKRQRKLSSSGQLTTQIESFPRDGTSPRRTLRQLRTESRELRPL